MTMQFVSFPKINQMREVIKNVSERFWYEGKDPNTGHAIYDYTKTLPVLTFRQTVKLHGTNASVIFDKDLSKYIIQSRNRVISIESDNAGFAMFVESRIDEFKAIAKAVADKYKDDESVHRVAIYGEYAGGNIQKGVAITQLPKSFYVFDVQALTDGDKATTDDEFLDNHALYNNDLEIYSITQFYNKTIELDFNKPDAIIETLLEECANVENECPVAKQLGVSGIGEGIVLKTIVDGATYRFKVKGDKHSQSKVQKLVAKVEDINIESMAKFVEDTVTDNRVQQGIDFLKEQGLELSPKSTGPFMRWIVSDINTEESDIIIKEEYDAKVLKSLLSRRAKSMFFKAIGM